MNKQLYFFSQLIVLFTISLASSACQTPCKYDRDCPLDRVCGGDGFCTVSCKYADGQCSNGQTCINGTCQTTCTGDGECATNYCSAAGVCSTKPTDDGIIQRDNTDNYDSDPQIDSIPSDNNKTDTDKDNTDSSSDNTDSGSDASN